MKYLKHLSTATGNWKWWYGCFLAVLVAFGCEARSGAHKSKSEEDKPKAGQQASQSVDDMPTGIFDARSVGAAKAWQRLTENGRYRVARTEDFSIPEAAMENEDHRRDIQRAIAFAYVGGDFNRDGNYKDRAFIVVDTTRNDSARFGLVIFNELADPNSIPEPHWVFREKDLSRTVMSWTRGEIILVEYREDGDNKVCRVKWDERNQKYSCE